MGGISRIPKRCGRSQPKHRSHSPFDLIQPRNFLEPALTGHTRFGFYILRFPNILYLFLTWVPPLSQPFGELADKLRQYPLLILYSILNTAKCAEIPLNGCFKSLFLPFACLPYPGIRRETHRTNRIELWCVCPDRRFAPISSRLRFPNILYLFQLEPSAFRNIADGSNFVKKAVASPKN